MGIQVMVYRERRLEPKDIHRGYEILGGIGEIERGSCAGIYLDEPLDECRDVLRQGGIGQCGEQIVGQYSLPYFGGEERAPMVEVQGTSENNA